MLSITSGTSTSSSSGAGAGAEDVPVTPATLAAARLSSNDRWPA